MKSLTFKFLLSLGFINLSIPILEELPTDLQPNSDLVKFIILPLVSAVLIPFFQRLLDKFLPLKKDDEKKD